MSVLWLCRSSPTWPNRRQPKAVQLLPELLCSIPTQVNQRSRKGWRARDRKIRSSKCPVALSISSHLQAKMPVIHSRRLPIPLRLNQVHTWLNATLKVWTACNTTQTETSVLGGCPDDFVPLESSRETGSYQLFIDTHSQREQDTTG